MNKFLTQITKFNKIVDKYDSFIFDFNGVLWYGPTRYKDAFVTLHKLRDMKKNIYFITNCSSDTRQQYAHYLWNAGFKTSYENVYPVTYFGPAFLKMRYPLIGKVYIIGGEGLVHEAKLAGLDVVPGYEHDDKKFANTNEFDRLPVDEEIEAVIVGEDLYFNYYKMSFASICIQQNNALFFSCTDDPYDFNGERNMPSCGALSKSIELASGRPYTILGKPHRHAVDLIVEKNKIDKKKTLMIGDRINADIAMARDAGIDSCLVLTGNTTQDMIYDELKKPNPCAPTHICWNLEMEKDISFII